MEFIKRLLSWLFSSYIMRSIIPYEIRKIFYVAEDMVDLKNTIRDSKNAKNDKSYDDDENDDDWDDDEEAHSIDELKNIIVSDTKISIGQIADASLALSKLSPEELKQWGQDVDFQNKFLEPFSLTAVEYNNTLQKCTSNAKLSEIYTAVVSGLPYKKNISEFEKNKQN